MEIPNRNSRLVDSINLSPSKFIIEWNNKYPYDRWWRKKYNIPFGSLAHREANFVNMVIEYKEDLLFNKMRNKEDEVDEETERMADEIISQSANQDGSKVVKKMTKKEIDDEFDNINLEEFN